MHYKQHKDCDCSKNNLYTVTVSMYVNVYECTGYTPKGYFYQSTFPDELSVSINFFTF